MSPAPRKRRPKGDEKVRVPFRRNRGTKPREGDWTRYATDTEGENPEAELTERVAAKGGLSRHRTVIVRKDEFPSEGLRSGIVIAMRGLYVDVDDGERVWSCTVRRVLRTRLIKERHPVTIGDRVRFTVESTSDETVREGAIEAVDERRGQLRRLVGRRIHTIVANVDQVIVVSSAADPAPKPHLVDRYIVAALAGEITPVICMNKIDLDGDGIGRGILERYSALGYVALTTSAVGGEGIDALRDILRGKASVVAGQSGVGKSSLLNAVQPGLQLRTADVMEQTRKGRHVTTTASLIRLDGGGFVVDTPGIRSFDLSTVPPYELEAYFVEFVPRVENCKFPDCTHTHETDCAIKRAVERGEIHPERYETYIGLLADAPGEEWEQ